MHFSRRALLAGLLGLAAAPAAAQSLGFGLGMQDVVVRAGGGGAALDPFTTPSGAYSFRKLRSSYTGSAVRIRRTSDNLELDIGFAGANFNTAAATAHCAATTCYGRWWYDQSGNARDIGNATAANQPQLVFNCNGALPCWSFSNALMVFASTGNFTPASGILTISVVANRSVGTTGFNALLATAGAANRMLTQSTPNWGIGTVLAAASNAAWHAGVGVFLGASTGSMQIDDGVPVTTGSAASTTTPGVISINGVAAHTLLHGEAIFWDGYAMPAGERTAWIANQRNYWTPLPLDSFTTPSGAYSFRKLKSTYSGPAMKLSRATGGTLDIPYLGATGFTGAPWDEATALAFCSGTNCFLDTWYNQGSGENLVQTTVANQPALIFNCNGSLPCFRMTAGTTQTAATVGTVTPATGVVTLSVVGARTVGTGICGFLRQNGTAAVNRLVGGSAGQWQVAATGSVARAAADAQWHVGLGVINGASSVLNIDGGESGGTATGILTAGVTGTAGAGTTTCEVGELLAWDAYAMPPAERTVLTANQKSFFGTP